MYRIELIVCAGAEPQRVHRRREGARVLREKGGVYFMVEHASFF